MQVPFLDLLRPYRALEAETNTALQAALHGGVYILGKEVAAFEREWAAYCGVAHCAGVGNGTDAIALALLACGIQPGAEVITAPLSAGYTALALRQIGAVPVFADIDPHTFTLSPAAVESALTPRTRAIIPVHLYGQMADMPALCALAECHGLFVIEDAAQAHGARWQGVRAGGHGHAATFSFYPTKNLGAFGDGGAVVSNDEALIERVKLLRQGGHLNALQGTTVGMNSRLDELHAAMLRVKLRPLDAWTLRRQQIAEHYRQAFATTKNLTLPVNVTTAEHVFHLFVVQSAQRKQWRTRLAERGIETLIHYPYLLHQQPLFKRVEQPPLPVAETVVNHIFSLPLNPHMTEAEIGYVIETVVNLEQN
ncbi:MAG: DegT/DnrJ/EryC1/StrS family aminotransferase [Acidobacteria bacterium]|nr:DegT/DnrJ/EryC1/StrS family aminotransferase [Acidobacteriota bacterium]MBI3424879.1 DegT/DnrJ/EryC1/StrS family aminotransferase [Acidobacteriota bacterium]